MSLPHDTSLIAAEVALRRTFAIISHPDAGKTTLTEKLLLYSGMLRTAGMVRGRKGSRAASSDWMALEQERGISITASAMQFCYKDTVINVLDTPGHQDFSEDTYRTLTAADSAVMVLDAAKGVEPQTRKLYAVCRMRNIPILTFINKMDLPGREPLELLHEVEEVLGIKAAPLNWPIGSGKEFVGVADCRTKEVLLFSRGAAGGAEKAAVRVISLSDLSHVPEVHPRALETFRYELELLDVAGNDFSRESFLEGKVTPVFFGSALTNFGVEPFFDSFAALAPAPRAYTADLTNGEEIAVDPVSRQFSAFVFKIQANMNPKHRDSMAFLRVCSGQFEREMVVKHHRTRKEVRLSRSHSMLARERSTLDAAFPGDIIGVTNPGLFSIGDTISLNGGSPAGEFNFKPMPQFPPEVVAQIRPLDVSKRKAFDKGIKQLCEEGTMQLLFSFDNPRAEPFVAAVGRLQFEVLQYRLLEEYGVKTRLDMLPQQYSAWLVGDPASFKKPSTSLLARDPKNRAVVLFTNQWEKQYAVEQNPQHSFVDFAA